MPIGDICIREMMIATRETTVQEAARLMRENHVGDLLVVDRVNGHRTPLGIVTDRDIVVAVVALDLDPGALSVGDIMGAELETAPQDQGMFETIHQMRSAGVRRIPVVTRQGYFGRNCFDRRPHSTACGRDDRTGEADFP
jgi:CBS domain-containing protein